MLLFLTHGMIIALPEHSGIQKIKVIKNILRRWKISIITHLWWVTGWWNQKRNNVNKGKYRIYISLRQRTSPLI